MTSNLKSALAEKIKEKFGVSDVVFIAPNDKIENYDELLSAINQGSAVCKIDESKDIVVCYTKEGLKYDRISELLKE